MQNGAEHLCPARQDGVVSVRPHQQERRSSRPLPTMEVPMSTVETTVDIRPFHVDIPEEKLADLSRLIEATRWPSKELVDDRSQGVQLATLQALARYWAT